MDDAHDLGDGVLIGRAHAIAVRAGPAIRRVDRDEQKTSPSQVSSVRMRKLPGRAIEPLTPMPIRPSPPGNITTAATGAGAGTRTTHFLMRRRW
jgi:hypothetical protein